MARSVSRRHRTRTGLRASASVNLISMMDILTVLLLFLLKSYSAGGEVMVPQPGVKLPSRPRRTAGIADRRDRRGRHRWAPEQVASIARSRRSQTPASVAGRRLPAAYRPGGVPAGVKGTIVTIRATATSVRAAAQVMFTLSQSSYDNVSLAVLRKA